MTAKRGAPVGTVVFGRVIGVLSALSLITGWSGVGIVDWARSRSGAVFIAPGTFRNILVAVGIMGLLLAVFGPRIWSALRRPFPDNRSPSATIFDSSIGDATGLQIDSTADQVLQRARIKRFRWGGIRHRPSRRGPTIDADEPNE